MARKIIIDGTNFDDIEGFYTEIDRVLTKNLAWNTGHNLDAFNDLLYGGFGVHEYYESIVIIWKNFEKSGRDLGYKATVKYYENLLLKCHPSNGEKIELLLEEAKQEKGDSLCDIIIGIISCHEQIELILK